MTSEVKMKNKNKPVKEPSLLRKLITIYYEQARRRKALRILAKQAWSLEFLSLALIRAAKVIGDGVQISVTDKEGRVFTLTYDKAIKSKVADIDDSILNHLDDNTAINQFIYENGRR